jgi:uncharacterized membrane protein YedE/YeeE
MTAMDAARSVLGGVMVGTAAAMFLYLNGRVLGISGIAGGLVDAPRGERGFRVWFLSGLLVGALVLLIATPGAIEQAPRSLPLLAGGGLLVGFGTRLSNGCTSGHGVCGLGRLSPRSLVATLTFIAAGALAVLAVRAGLGGAS